MRAYATFSQVLEAELKSTDIENPLSLKKNGRENFLYKMFFVCWKMTLYII